MAPTQEADQEIVEVFRQMGSLMSCIKDQTLKLEPDPSQLKKARKGEGPKGPGRRVKEERQSEDKLHQMVNLLARLALRQDQALQFLSQEDSFLFYFNNREASGSLQVLLRAAATWREQSQSQSSSIQWMPLRQKLLQVLLQTLQTRLQELMSADPQSELRKAALANQVLLADQCCPFLQWNPHLRKLQVSTRTPLSLQKVIQNVGELIDMCANQELIKQFHALQCPAESITIPWILQVSMRADREHALLQTLCQSSVWVLMGTTMKSHRQQRSGLASQLALLLNPHQPKGKGKGKTRS